MQKKSYKLKNGQTLIIRQAIKSDANELINYLNFVAGETDFLIFGKDELGFTLEQECEYIQKRQDVDNSILFVAIINNQIIGNLGFDGGIYQRVRHIGEMGITIKKKFWNIGVGTKLMESLLSWAKKNNIIKKINLQVRQDNKNAIKLYEKFDFKIEGIIKNSKYINNTFFDAILMGKILN